MDILNIFPNERSSSIKKIKFNKNKTKKKSLDNSSLITKKKKINIDDNSLKSEFSLKLKKDYLNQ